MLPPAVTEAKVERRVRTGVRRVCPNLLAVAVETGRQGSIELDEEITT
ncbi:MAG: hypothetical protein ACRDRX_24925 [Pseudonocardiaceae bacterium]